MLMTPRLPYSEQSNSESSEHNGGLRTWGDEEITGTVERILGAMEILI